MKVSILTMQFPAPRETFASQEIRKLKELGIEVNVHCMRPVASYSKKLVHERGLAQLPIYNSTLRDLLMGIGYMFTFPLASIYLLNILFKDINRPVVLFKSLFLLPVSFTLSKRILRSKPDIIHLYWSHYPAIVGLIIRRLAPKTKITLSLAAYDLTLKHQATKALIPLAQLIFTHCKVNVPDIVEMCDDLSEKYIQVIYRGVDEKYILNKRPAKQPNHICTAGALIKEKRFDKVINLFAAIQEKIPDSSLTILGDGPERKNLEELANSLNLSIDFKGHVTHNQVIDEMSKSEIFLFLSEKVDERLPNVIKEAMANYCFCISSMTPGIEELIRPEIGKIISKNENVYITSSKIIEILYSKQDDKLKAGRNHIFQNFNLSKEMEAYIHSWRSIEHY